jgi:BirA family transcriptional regulator, biotin operon repressor / biotin---[acetyl-CoA-carboxylase] ligase
MVPADGVSPFLARAERFASVPSTNDVVRSWLAEGTPEVCLAIADEQTAGRGRAGRRWVAPAGAALLASVGFRPTWLPVDRAWRLGPTVALAMVDAAEEAVGLPEGSIGLKWPNDLVIQSTGPDALLMGELTAEAASARLRAPIEVLKLGGVLGESEGLGTDDPRIVIGIGVNADWAARDFPPELAGSMTSLREAAVGRPVDVVMLLDGFTARLEARIEALRAGYFDLAGWIGRQVTTGREVRLQLGDEVHTARAIGVDTVTGALVLADPGHPGGERLVHAGEVTRLRLATAPGDPASGPPGAALEGDASAGPARGGV